MSDACTRFTPPTIYVNGREFGRHLEGTVTIEQEMIDTPSLGGVFRPDPDWTHLDPEGHFHAASHEHGPMKPKRLDEQFPTLDRRTNWDRDDDDEDPREWWQCKICGAEVTPRMIRTSDLHARTPGRIIWKVDLAACCGAADALRDLHGKIVSWRAVSKEIGLEHFGIGRLLIHKQFVGLRSVVAEINWTGPLGTRQISGQRGNTQSVTTPAP